MVSWTVSPLQHQSCLNKHVLLTFWRSVAGESICPSSLLVLPVLLLTGVTWMQLLMLLWSMKGQCICFVSRVSARSIWYCWSIKMLSQSLSFLSISPLRRLKTKPPNLKYELSFKWSITFNVLSGGKIITSANWCNLGSYFWILLVYFYVPFMYHLSTTLRKNVSLFSVYYSVSQKCFLLEDVKISLSRKKN